MKKDETRFTIRFNLADPRHQIAMNALSAAGRRKSTLIADAICEYLARHSGEGMADVLSLISPSPIHAQNVAALQNESPSPEPTPEANEDRYNASDNQDFDDDMRNAVLGGLSAFRT